MKKTSEPDNTIARFECKATAGIGYAYAMRAEYKNLVENTVNDDPKWSHLSEEGKLSVNSIAHDLQKSFAEILSEKEYMCFFGVDKNSIMDLIWR